MKSQVGRIILVYLCRVWSPLSWLVLILGGVLIVGGAIWKTTLPSDTSGHHKERLDLGVDQSVEQKLKASDLELQRKLENFEKSAVEAVRGFMESKTSEERCRWVRGGGALKQTMEEFYQREGQEAPEGFGQILSIHFETARTIPMLFLAAEDSGSGQQYPFNFLQTRDGKALIDWESSVRYGEMEWEKFVDKHPVKPVQLRVYFSPARYYNYEFSDDSQYMCYQIRSHGSTKKLYGYVERNSEINRKLIEGLFGGGAFPVNARLKFLPWSTNKSMVWIEELLHKDWANFEELEKEFGSFHLSE